MKKIMSVLLTVTLLVSMSANVFALPSDMKPHIDVITSGEAGSVANNALGMIQWFGYALAIGMLIYIGIKYMMASANEKADLKKGSINYIIGAVLVAAASAIVGIVVDFGSNITQS